MKSNILIVALSFTSLLSFSQITITDNNLLEIGDIIYLATDETNSVNIGSSGQNQTWDFSNLQNTESWSMEVVDPIITPFDQLYPNANLCIIDDGDFIYCNKNSGGIDMLGIGDSVAQQSIKLIPLPLFFSSSFTDGPVNAIDSIIGGPMVDILLSSQGLSASLLTFGAAQVADSLSVQLELTTDFEVDGEGIMILPSGSFDALRVKIERTTVPNISIYCIDTNGGINSGWYPLSFGGGAETELMYQWYSNDLNSKFTLAEVYMDSVGNPETGVSFITNSVSNLESLEIDNINIYQNPLSYFLSITCEDNEIVEANLSDINGRLIKSFKFTKSLDLDLSKFKKGTYILHLNSKKGYLSKKITVK